MRVTRPRSRRFGWLVLTISIGLTANLQARPAYSSSCTLPTEHAGVTFPVERVPDSWVCRLQPIVNNYTVATKIGPVRTPLPETVYTYLLDHPPMAAALVNRLDLGLYQAEARHAGRFWVTDGEGTDGEVDRVYQDPMNRIYYLEGRHNGALLPQMTGKAVVLLRLRAVKDVHGAEAVEATLVSYLRLDNAFVSGLLSLIRPLIGKVVTRQLMKGFDAAGRLSGLMADHPERVLHEATDPPPLSDQDVAFLTQAVAALQKARRSSSPETAP